VTRRPRKALAVIVFSIPSCQIQLSGNQKRNRTWAWGPFESLHAVSDLAAANIVANHPKALVSEEPAAYNAHRVSDPGWATEAVPQQAERFPIVVKLQIILTSPAAATCSCAATAEKLGHLALFLVKRHIGQLAWLSLQTGQVALFVSP
jgi:hypothetical protein